MTSPKVVVESVSALTRLKYWEVVSNVFAQANPEQLRQGMSLFGAETRFFAVEHEGEYASVLFLTPVALGPYRMGGIGGVCTLPEYSGLGYGRAVLERALSESEGSYSALLLWTRIPGYFLQFGFVEMPEIFVAEQGGSCPMLFFHEDDVCSIISGLRDLPREYF